MPKVAVSGWWTRGPGSLILLASVGACGLLADTQHFSVAPSDATISRDASNASDAGDKRKDGPSAPDQMAPRPDVALVDGGRQGDGGGDGGEHVGTDASDANALGFVASNEVPLNAAGTRAVTFDSPCTLGADSGEIQCGMDGGASRPAGTGLINGIHFSIEHGLGVFTFQSLDIQASASPIKMVGNNPIVLVSASVMTIAALLDLEGGCPIGSSSLGPPGAPGPGGESAVPPNVPLLGCSESGSQGTQSPYGGGGGGFSGPGAAGADQFETDAGALGGSACTLGAPNLVPLYGGAAGGNASIGDGGIFGGNGGGAIQLVAKTSITVSGIINAGGCGGMGASPKIVGAGGGGSGGAILLESPVVTLTAVGVLAANGGGGGGGEAEATQGGNGGNGGASSQVAQGGAGGAYGSPGGNGAAGSKLTGSRSIEAMGNPGGGGGGGAGRIRINTTTGQLMLLDGGIVSPSMASSASTIGTLAN